MAKKSVAIKDPKAEDTTVAGNEGAEKNQSVSFSNAPTFRVITGSYEHNLLCVSLALVKGSEVFNPVFHFTPHSQSIRCLASTKRYLVSGSNDEHIRIYDLQKRKELGTLLHHSGSITCLSFFASKWLLSGAGDGKLCLWRVKDWEVLSEMKGHKGEINDVSIHPTGKIALSVGSDRTIRLWNLMTGKKASILKVKREPLKVQWTPDGTHFVVAFDRSVAIYSAESSEVVQEETFTSPIHHMEIVKVGSSDDDDVYVARSHSNGKIIFTKLSAFLEGDTEPTFELVGHASRVKQFDLFYHQPTENYYLASVSSDGKLVVWDMAVQDQVAVYNTGDRLNCCLCVPEEVEKAETMKKRAHPDDENASEPDDTDYSESEAELPPKKKKNKKTKKSKISVELE